MLKLIATLAFALYAAVAHAQGTAVIGMEYTLGYPTFQYWWTECYSTPGAQLNFGNGTDGVQCVAVPGTIFAMTGTSTLKTSGNEILADVRCNGVRVWSGNHMAGTVPINISGLELLGLTGPCYVGIQQSGGYSPSGYEIQLVFFYR